MEARALLGTGLAAIAAALVWLFGPWGLLGIGVAYTLAALFLVDVKERAREAVAEPDRAERGYPLRR